VSAARGIAYMMMLKSAPKGYTLDTHRASSPAATLKQVQGAVPKAGITRVADITGLDRIGIPVFTSVRPGAAGGAVTVYAGKGFTKEEAQVSAIMEGVERHAAEPRCCGCVVESHDELELAHAKGGDAVLDPTRLILPATANYRSSDRIEWFRGFSITNGNWILVPAEAVFHPYRRTNQLFRTNTNGLAVGNILEEAVLHGLMEVIERDAWSLFEHGTLKGRDLKIGPEMTGPIGEIAGKLIGANVKAHAKDITSDVGIATVAVALDDETTRDPALLSLGVGTHLDPEIAAMRAFTEAVQSRLTTIHGTREDTYKADFARRAGYERMKRINRKWFEEAGAAVSMGEMPAYRSTDFLDDIRYTLQRLASVGLNEAVVAELTRSETAVPAVRVIVPGLEVYAMDKDRAGKRLRGANASR